MPPVIRYGPSLVISMAGSLALPQSVWERASAQSTPKLSAPEGQSRTAMMISSIRPPLGATNGSWLARKTVASRSVQKPECWHNPRLSKIVTCWPG